MGSCRPIASGVAWTGFERHQFISRRTPDNPETGRGWGRCEIEFVRHNDSIAQGMAALLSCHNDTRFTSVRAERIASANPCAHHLLRESCMTFALPLPADFFCQSRLRIAIAFLLAALALTITTSAHACACCSQTAWRHVEIEKLAPRYLDEINQLRFAKTAQLMMREADDDAIKGVTDPQENYDLAIVRTKDRWAFSFRDKKGRTGTLTLALPKTISVFEIDPRHGKDEGHGPALYKEWKLTAKAAGDGLFRATVGGNQKITLVLHGRGNACTSADHFTHWTLLVHGPVDTFTMYGALQTGSRQ